MGSLILHLPVAGGVGRSRSGRVDFRGVGFNGGRSRSILRWTKKSGDGCRRLMASASPSASPPWLMLPPERDSSSGYIIHNFYCPSDQKHLTFAGGFAFNDDIRIVGSSNGWLAVVDKSKNHLFLTDPLSGRRIDLPTLDKLPDRKLNLPWCQATVWKVVLSCSPDAAEECRALMAFGPEKRLALCSVGRSDTWTPIGRTVLNGTTRCVDLDRREVIYEDFTYCRRLESFICQPVVVYDDDRLRQCDNLFLHCSEYWFAGGDPTVTSNYIPNWLDDFPEEWDWRTVDAGNLYSTTYLVLVEHLNQLLYVVRYEHSVCDVKFLVYRAEIGIGNRMRVVMPLRKHGDSLDDLAIFVGINRSFAVVAADYPNIKPNSIYFINDNDIEGCTIQIYDVENDTNSTLMVSPECTTISPLWFNPPSSITFN